MLIADRSAKVELEEVDVLEVSRLVSSLSRFD
jgi:hypothetical protein